MKEIAVSVLTGLMSGGLASLIVAVQNFRVRRVESKKVLAETESIAVKSLSDALNRLRADYQELVSESEELKKHIRKLKSEINSLYKLLDKINSCTAKEHCVAYNDITSNLKSQKYE